jgi:outer membrane receptor protein involved in Fe transport
MNRKLLASAICASLFVAGTAYAQDNTAPQQAQDQSATAAQPNTSNSQQDQEKKAKTLNTITVTGSLIPQSKIETANPTITITAQDMTNKGFANVYDALRSQPLSTGAVQDSQFSAGFTPGAETISLLGLPPDFTLFLINGRPMADFPLLYNGSANFVDLSNIPMSMVDHIDILPGNQSSIYGSAAIAGVVNVVLKKKMEGYDISYRAGGYSDGGGQQQRFSFSGGHNTDKLGLLYSLQVDDRHPMFGYNRDLTASTLSNPNPNARYATPAVVAWQWQGFNAYMDPNAVGGCGALGGLFNGTVTLQHRPNRGIGNFCGSTTELGYSTLQNKKRDYSGYVNLTYQINSNTQLFGSLLYAYQKQRFYAGPNYNWWAPDNGNYIYNPASGYLEFYEKLFSPEEIGGPLVNADNQTAKMYNGDVGIRGSFGDSDWNYEAYYSRADYKLADKQLRPLAGPVEDFFRNMFLGPQLGTTSGYAIYEPDFAKFLQPITPAEYRGFSDYIRSTSHTYTQLLNLQVTNASLFHLPGGDVGFAGVLQAGNQMWDNPTDPRVIAGDFWGLTGTSGYGKRDNYAAAVEFLVPIFSKLNADISARYDRYSNQGVSTSDSKATYKLGLEYRPFDTLLLRANYATAFRAPDMAYVFQGPSGFYSFATDYYKCEKYAPNDAIQDCPWDSVQYKGTNRGNPDLKSITAKSWGYGVVWSPTNNLTAKADYYDVRINNEVTTLSVDGLMRTEADCRLGKLDPNSAACVDAFARIQRSAVNPKPAFSENLQGVSVNPVNVSTERVKGIVAALDYKLDAGRFGDFTFGANYNVTLSHHIKQYAESPNIDLLRHPEWSWANATAGEFKTVFTGSVTWDIGNWSTTLSGTRFGSSPNYQALNFGYGTASSNGPAGTLAPWIIYNGSLKYQVTPDISTQLIVNNIKNSMPPRDTTWVGWPYYNPFNYNPFGRIIWLSLNIHLGGK